MSGRLTAALGLNRETLIDIRDLRNVVYRAGTHSVDVLLVGYREGRNLMFAGKGEGHSGLHVTR
jgi:hypothetical protein